MIRFTLIARASDALPLVATMESQADELLIETHKKWAKQLIHRISPLDNSSVVHSSSLPSKGSVAAGQFTFHYICEDGIVFICIADKAYPRLLAFAYLCETIKSFLDSASALPSNHGLTPEQMIAQVVRPYAFIKFEPLLQSIKQRYLNSRQLKTQEDLVDLSSRLQGIGIFQAADVLGEEYLLYGGSASPFGSFSSLNVAAVKAAKDVVATARNLVEEKLDISGVSSAERKWWVGPMISLCMITFLTDLGYLWLEYAYFVHKDMTGFSVLPIGQKPWIAHILTLFVGLMAPLLIVQAYMLNKTNAYSAFSIRLIKFITGHAILVLVQLTHSVLCVFYDSVVFTALFLMSRPPRSFDPWHIPVAFFAVKLGWALSVLSIVGFGTVWRLWTGQSGYGKRLGHRD
ncbi:Longin-like domain-containing protein [Polychytrium aggregatum]|uniref:Longin-like domain-containing protein n=1 Tax=Polychytrium aggregatum TaxID=110093 RepID=UPI0022FEEDC7|nr:Longin-like domain-containing protein [Polychytrium aggregatum]KAI9206313.1 Longin-like domain-containing protein [Polychytrium aggregatum]